MESDTKQSMKVEDGQDGKKTFGDYFRIFPEIPKLSTPISALDYNMSHPKRGKLLLFNQKEFDLPLGLNSRKGTDVDRDRLASLFESLGFDVTVYNDSSYWELKKHLGEAAREDHTDNDCFACIILTHGDEGVLYSKDAKFTSSDLWTPFLANNCPSLAGKPKLFFIQACQGDGLDQGINVKGRVASTDSLQVLKIPVHADFLIAWSTVPGYYSWRNTEEGSWFVQALYYVICKYHNNMDLLSMMTLVNHTVAYNFQSNSSNQDMNQKKQMPYICSMLTRRIFLHPKNK